MRPPRADLPAEVHQGAYLLFYEQLGAGSADPGGAAAAARPADTGQDPRERSGGEDPPSPELVESDGEEAAPPGRERGGGIGGPAPGLPGERRAGPEPTWGGEIECDEEPTPPPGGPQTAADDDQDSDVTMEDATDGEEDQNAIMQDSG